MLLELAVRDLGVIESMDITFGPGMTALTGETGAGKTLVVGAIQLLVGDRADASMVRSGATEAVVEGRFDLDGTEIVLRRVVPSDGRSRAYRDGSMCTATSLGEVGSLLVDLHGQHAHQSLLKRSAQRRCLDEFAAIDLEPLAHARDRERCLDAELADLGGDSRERARELELLDHQLDEILRAQITDGGEDDRLAHQEAELGDAVAHREAGWSAIAALGEDGASDAIGLARGALSDRGVFSGLDERLAAIETELDDIRTELRRRVEAIEEDPDALDRLRHRRRTLHELMRKYGANLSEVAEFGRSLVDRREQLMAHDASVDELEAERAEIIELVNELSAKVGDARRAAAPALASAIQANLASLAMGEARIEVDVGSGAGEDVELRIAPNPGAASQPLAKIASGGELSRTMLAIRRVLTDAPPCLVFDEVDAGVGGRTGTVLGEHLHELGTKHQVLVVTHLPQVAAVADAHLVLDKRSEGQRTITAVRLVEGDERQAEIARMLSGSPESTSALRHAGDLLETGSC